MAAFSPRKTFANPLVVTLATIPACFTESSPPPQQPQPQPQVAPSPIPPRPTEGTIENPPRPQPAPGGSPTQAGGAPTTYNFDQRWTVMKSASGTCSAMARVDCPKPKKPGDPVPTCNPPPPMKIACPDGWDGKEALSIVQLANQSECMIEPKPVKCPPNVACNPPPPRKVACPTYQ